MKDFILYFNSGTLEYQATFSSYKAIVDDIKNDSEVKNYFRGIACHIEGDIFFLPDLRFYESIESIIEYGYKLTLEDFVRFVKNNDYFIFNFTHGKYGEDGIFQSVCTYFDIPTNMFDYESAFLTYSKYNTLLFIKENIKNVKIPQTFYFNLNTTEEDFEGIVLDLDFGCKYIVKANNLGSSIGMEVYDNLSVDILIDYRDRNSKYTNSFIIQKFIEGKEVTVGVFKYKDRFIDLPAVVPESKKGFLDFFVKHSNNGINIKIFKNESLGCRLNIISQNIYNKINLMGAVRIDYIIKDDDIYFLEVNLLPGLGEHSVLPIMLKEVGISRADFIKMSIENFYNGTVT